jgi:hypothetical protein
MLGLLVAVAEGVIAAVLLVLVILIRRAFRAAARGRHTAPPRPVPPPGADPELAGWQRKMVADLARFAADGELVEAAGKAGLHLANRLRVQSDHLADVELARQLLMVIDHLEFSVCSVDGDESAHAWAIGQILGSAVLELTVLEHAPLVAGP